MGWKQWSMVAVVIGGGILLQIPGHDVMDMDGNAGMDLPTHGSEAEGASASVTEPPAPYTTVVLAVTGMT